MSLSLLCAALLGCNIGLVVLLLREWRDREAEREAEVRRWNAVVKELNNRRLIDVTVDTVLGRVTTKEPYREESERVH